MRERRYELCVIGAGTAGFAAAEAGRAAGRELLLVTGEDELGGTCILRGCMPAKTLLAASEREAAVERAAQGIRYRTATLAAAEVGEALVTDQTEGFVKMLAREDDGVVVGITLVTNDAIDLAGEAIALVDRGMSVREIAEMPHLHPTMSELFLRVAERLSAA